LNWLLQGMDLTTLVSVVQFKDELALRMRLPPDGIQNRRAGLCIVREYLRTLGDASESRMTRVGGESVPVCSSPRSMA
jgi:hypothetical protein